MTFYPVSEWPHIAILDPRTGERLITWSRVPDAATFCDLITEFLTLHPVFDSQAAATAVKRQSSDDEVIFFKYQTCQGFGIKAKSCVI
jgi:hypothetical protein